MKYDYKQAIEALAKAYKLNSFEAIETVKNQIFKDFGNTIAYEIEDQARYMLKGQGNEKQ